MMKYFNKIFWSTESNGLGNSTYSVNGQCGIFSSDL